MSNPIFNHLEARGPAATIQTLAAECSSTHSEGRQATANTFFCSQTTPNVPMFQRFLDIAQRYPDCVVRLWAGGCHGEDSVFCLARHGRVVNVLWTPSGEEEDDDLTLLDICDSDAPRHRDDTDYDHLNDLVERDLAMAGDRLHPDF